MAERSSSLACKKFSANVFDKNKCQNCFKPRETHQDVALPTSPGRPTTLEVPANRAKTIVKSGTLSVATHVSTLPNVFVQKWEKVWFVLYSSGVLEWYSSEAPKSGESALGYICLDDCIGLIIAEVDTNEPFSIGIKTSEKVHYLKADNRLEMDNWCRVLKPFVIASPGYNFSQKSSTTRAFSFHDTNKNSSTNVGQEKKTSLTRTASAPWQASLERKGNGGARESNFVKKRWSVADDFLTKEGEKQKNAENSNGSLDEVKSTESVTKQMEAQVETRPTPQPDYSEKYLKPQPTDTEQNNGETAGSVGALETELLEARRLAKHSQSKAEMCSKNLSDTKKKLDKANNVISIQKASIDALRAEGDTLRSRLKYSDEKVEKRLKELESGLPSCNGSASPDSIESSFIKLQAKLQENEKALIRRTRELEKANESRKKVAKHTRTLLLELEGKLTENNRRISELEEQLMNKTLDFEYEKEEREKIEREKLQLMKEFNISQANSKKREITKRSTELLQQARDEHRSSKIEQKSLLKHVEEIESYKSKLETKNVEIEKLRHRLVAYDKKDDEVRMLETEYKNANEQLDVVRRNLETVKKRFGEEEAKCRDLEAKLKDISAKLQDKESVAKKVQRENVQLTEEMGKMRKESDKQITLLRKDYEATRSHLLDVEQELDAFRTETDGKRVNEVEELNRNLEELKSKWLESDEECKKLREAQLEITRNFHNEKNQRLRLEKDLQQRCSEVRSSREELAQCKELLRKAEEKVENDRQRVEGLEKIIKAEKSEKEKRDVENASELSQLREKTRDYEAELKTARQQLDENDGKLLRFNEEFNVRLDNERECLKVVGNVLKCLSEIQPDVVNSERVLNVVGSQGEGETNLLDAVKLLRDETGRVKNYLGQEKERVLSCERSLRAEMISRRGKCDSRGVQNSDLVRELEETKEAHRMELQELEKSLRNETQTVKCHGEEIKLKLTSKVILLQSDISELKAKHERELKQANERHREEGDSWREKCESVDVAKNKEIEVLREKINNLDAQLLSERQSNKREINALRKEYEEKTAEHERLRNGLVSHEELEEIRKQHSKELEEIKDNHRKELEENKSDMMMVLQALKSDSYQSSTMSNESLEMNDELKKLERYVETLKKDHEEEIRRINEEHEHALEQLRSDMVTLVRVQETYKTPHDAKVDPKGNIGDLDEHLETMRRSHEKELQEKEARHRNEVDQLKSDMLVAIQAASAVGSIGSQSPDSRAVVADKRARELEEQIEKMEQWFEEERESLRNAVKKAESATKFGLRRNEEMSNKIYQMQREMEEIDTKYQKEIKLYKEAFDQEKIRKTTIGAVPGILAENESLKVKLQEVELSMEKMQVRYDSEIKRYKEKFQQDNVLSVEELHLKIKSLEDTIEEMRLEHQNELERYIKAVKRGKVSLTSTAKERDLERKIDDLESRVDVMRQKHREETRKYRERLEDEMEKHRKEVSESRAKLRKLEADNRQMDDLKNKITEFENKTMKLAKEAGKCKEQESELTETKAKNRELQRQVDALKRKVEKMEEAIEQNDRTGNELPFSARAKLSRYSSCDNIGSNSQARGKSLTNEAVDETRELDVFELNNNSGKAEVAGYKLNPTLKRPASVSAFPVQNENGTRRATYNERRRDSGSTSNRSSYQSGYLKTSGSVTSPK